MKILFVQKMNGISGSELYMMQIMPELKRRGHDVEMLIIYPTPGTNNGRFINYLAEYGVKTHEIYNHKPLSPFLIYKFYKILKKGRYDLVQSNLIHADFLVAVTKFFLYRKLKMLSVKHGYYPAYQARYGMDLRHVRRNLYYWIAKFTSNAADFNITISMGLYKVFTDGDIVKPAKIRNIYYGLTLAEPVEKFSISVVPIERYVLIVGRLVSFKGHRYLIEAWKKVYAKLPDLKLFIAGEGECHKELEKLVADAGLQGTIIFAGHVPNPHPLIEKCEFTLVTSTCEGFGLILLESWMHKKPIIAFDAPAMNEVIDNNENGLLAKLKDVEDLADKIIWLYNHKMESERMGINGFNKLNDYYTLKRMTEETEEVYRLVAGK